MRHPAVPAYDAHCDQTYRQEEPGICPYRAQHGDDHGMWHDHAHADVHVRGDDRRERWDFRFHLSVNPPVFADVNLLSV